MTGIESGTAHRLVEILFDGMFSQIWPLIALPTLAAFIGDRVARRLPPTRADWRAAAALAAFPGLVMLTLIGMIAVRGVLHMHSVALDHLVKYHVPMVLAAALLGRAVWRFKRRNRHFETLLRLSRRPSPRLQKAAVEASIQVRELDDEGSECFVAGIFKPVAFVSRGAIDRMSDTELAAALHHERAHAESHDPAMLALLSVLGDLAPRTDRALTAYRQARERRADQQAARHVGACALASALLALTRKSAPIPAFGMAGTDSGTWRLQAILGVEPELPNGAHPVFLWSGLAANLMLFAWPAPHIYVAYRLCCP